MVKQSFPKTIIVSSNLTFPDLKFLDQHKTLTNHIFSFFLITHRLMIHQY